MGYLGRSPTPSPIDTSDIPANSIDASKIIDGAIAVADVADNAITEDKIADAAVVSLKSGRKNLIINGGFDVWQRGTTHSNTNDFHADRWGNGSTTCTTTKEVENNKNYLRMTGTSASSTPNLYQRLEYTFYDETISVSFYARSSIVQTINIVWKDADGTIFDTQSFTTSSSWQRFTFQFTNSTLTTSGNYIVLYPALSTGDTFDIKDYQLELGSVATDFEHRSYGEELALCQRYFEKLTFANGTMMILHKVNSTAAYGGFSYKHKRTQNPTITLPTAVNNGSSVNGCSMLTMVGGFPPAVGTVATSEHSSNWARFNVLNWPANGGTGDSTWLYFTGTSDPYITVDAEL